MSMAMCWMHPGECTIGAMSDYDGLTEDPCSAQSTYSHSRAVAFVLLFIAMFGFAFFAIQSESLVGTLVGSVMGYTAAVMIYGFARNRNGIQPFLFTCPVVVSQYPRLLKRHAVFLALVIVFLSSVVKNKPHQSEPRPTSSGRDISPSFFLVFIPLAALALTEIFTNRGVLERAHNDHFGEKTLVVLRDDNDFGRDKALPREPKTGARI